MDALFCCRVCLSNSSQEYIELEALHDGKESFLECFNACTLLAAESGDELPGMLCSKCAKDLQIANEFIMTARKTDTMIRSRLQAKNFQILSPNNDTFNGVDIERMEIVVIKSMDNECLANALPQENEDMETYAIDHQSSYDSENDRSCILEIPEQESISKINSSWNCNECNRIFDGTVPYEEHMNWHQKLNSLKCMHCAKCFRTEKSLEKHLNARHKHKSDEDTKQQQQHNKIENESPYKETFISIDQDLKAPENSTEDKICVYSAECETINSDIEIKPQEFDKLQECHICNKKLLSRNMPKHLKSHTNAQDDFLCAYCPRHFKNQKSLRQHEKLHFEELEDNSTCICSICDRKFTAISLLDQHRKNAHKEREHTCTICGNSFKLRNQLNNHMKLHLEKNIQCPHCEKKYARQFDLKIHLRSHTGEMPYPCHLCEKRFSIKVHLTYHLQKHYGVKHTCKECGAQFNSKQKLKSHSFKHTGMPYRCEICDNHGFPNRDVFKRHLIRVHQVTITEEALLEMFQRYTGKTTKIREVSNKSFEEEIETSQLETNCIIKVDRDK